MNMFKLSKKNNLGFKNGEYLMTIHRLSIHNTSSKYMRYLYNTATFIGKVIQEEET